MPLSADHGSLDYQNSAFCTCGGEGGEEIGQPTCLIRQLIWTVTILRWYALPLGSTCHPQTGDKISDLAENKERYEITYKKCPIIN